MNGSSFAEAIRPLRGLHLRGPLWAFAQDMAALQCFAGRQIVEPPSWTFWPPRAWAWGGPLVEMIQSLVGSDASESYAS